MANRDETARIRVVLAGAGVLLGMFLLPMLRGQVFVHDDLSYYFLPLRAFFADCLTRGDDPSWCPNLFGGFSLLGEGNGVAHPWVRFLYGALPFRLAFNAELLWPYPVLLLGFVLLLRRWDVPRDAALFGGMMFAFGGYHLLHYIHLSVMGMLAHLPWLLLAIDVTLRAPDRRSLMLGRVAVTLLTASQLLYAHVQFAWISSLGEVAYALFLAYREPMARRRLVGLAVSKGCGVLGAAAQILPLWESYKGSERELPTPVFVAMGSLPPLNLLQWVAPYLTASRVVTPPMRIDGGWTPPAGSMNDWRTHEFAVYYGAALPALLLVLFLGRKRLGAARPLALFALALASGALVLAFGDYTPLFRLVTKVPVIGGFRVSARYLVLVHLGICTLAALAFARLASADPDARPTWRRLWPLALPVVASLLVCLLPSLPEGIIPRYLRGEFIAPTPFVLAGPLLVAVATALVAFAARGWRGALIGLVVFVVADTTVYGVHAMRLNKPRGLARFQRGRHVPHGDLSGRVKFDQVHMTWQNPYTMRGLKLIQGYVALMPKRQLTYDRAASLRVAGVAWELPTTDDGWRSWVAVPDPLPRVRLVTRSQPTTDANRDLDTIDVATTALTAGSIPPLPLAEPGAARLEQDRPGALDVATEAATRQLLVVSEGYHKGWSARLDGRTCPVFRVNGDFLGCVVPPGAHRLALRFEPASRTVGAGLSALGLVLGLIVPFWNRTTRAGRYRGLHTMIYKAVVVRS